MDSSGRIYATQPEELLTNEQAKQQHEDQERLQNLAEKPFDMQLEHWRQTIAARRERRGAPPQE